jgi:hypothetical protein
MFFPIKEYFARTTMTHIVGRTPPDAGGPKNILTKEQNRNISQVSVRYGVGAMVRAVLEEASALAALALFVATIAVWVQVLGVT